MGNVDMKNELLFKRGYLITDNDVVFSKDNWITINVGKFSVHIDALNNHIHFEEDEKKIFILGYMIDTTGIAKDMHAIVRSLFSKLDQSLDDFYNYLDVLSGRYIVLFDDGMNTRILSDATGMKSIVYSTKKNVISSHMSLVKEMTNACSNPDIKDEWKKKYKKGYAIPGHHTPFEDIYYLTPNTLLEVESKEVVRFFPRENIVLRDIKEIVQEVSQLVQNQMQVIGQQNKQLIFSLTAGNDSRTTLALMKNFVNEMKFFTYYKMSKKLPEGVKSLEIDRKVVTELVDNLNLNHMFIGLDEDYTSDAFDRFIRIMKINTISPHSYRLAKFYLDYLPNEALHIRSNILEIGRYFYRSKLKLSKEVDSKSLAICYSPIAGEDQEIIDIFESYYQKTQMDRIYNYDGLDLFYWEYRMGIWHSKLLLESDIAHDTFIPFNSRNILKLLLSVSDNDKKNNVIFKKIIDSNWPILNYWGVNTLEKKIESFDQQIDGYGMNLQNLEFTKNPSNAKVKRYIYNNKAKFYLEKSAPEKSEYVQAHYKFKTAPLNWYSVILNLRSPYESKKHTGRMKYQILLGDKLLLEEDISAWKETNQIQIQFKALENQAELNIKVVAMKDCESWNWGKAATMIVERISIRKSVEEVEMVKASSPYSHIINQ